MSNLQPPVYIPSIEASDIWLHNHYDQPLYIKYVGALPSSLELESLFDHGINIFPQGKRRTNDIININFSKSVKPVADSIKKLNTKLSDIKKQLAKYTGMLSKANSVKETERIQNKIDSRNKSVQNVECAIANLETTHWDEMDTKDLRYAIYSDDGFFIEYKDKVGNVDKIQYVISSRSSAKSRIGKVLAIRKELHKDMKSWRRMGLNLDDRKDVDFVSVLAYESLVGSSIVDTIEINPDSILVIDDYTDIFSEDVNLVSVDKDTGLLINKKGERAEFKNVIWDGQALLSEEYFKDTKYSMFLLRQHWFKAAAFRTNIQEFMKERADELGEDCDTWKLPNLYGGTILAKDVKMITTPSALKFMKIAHVVGNKEQMYQHWTSKINEGDNLFGVVKTEKSTKLGYTDDGQPIQQMSYQYLNSLPISEEKLKELAKFELGYIDKLKNDKSVFIDYVLSRADMTNGNKMMAALYKHNPDIVGTKMFREWKKDQIREYVKRVKMGKLKIPNADYMVLLSNPLEMLYASVGMFEGSEMALTGQQVYCKAFEWEDKHLIGMRSPHTSMSNVLSCINTKVGSIDTYFPNLSNNIVIINNIGATVFETLNGADADSDAMWMSDNSILTKIAQECNKDYLVCKGDKIETKPNGYTVCLKDMASIDTELKNDFIGRVTNIAALLCSHIWDSKAKGQNIDSMLDKLSVLSITQGLVIDYAKRIPKISIKKQVTDANKLLTDLLGEDKHIPKWWKVRNKDIIKQEAKKKKDESEKKVKVVEDEYVFDCPMDYLFNTFDQIKNADDVKDVDIQKLIRSGEAGKANNKQKHIINELLDDANDKLKSSQVKNVDKEEKRELQVGRLDTISFAVELLSKLKMNEDTMYAIIQNIIKNKVDNSTIRSFNMLYHAKKTLFITTA